MTVSTVVRISDDSGTPAIQLSINRVIKGSLKPSDAVIVLLPSGNYTFPKDFTSLVGKSGIWFLVTTNNTEYVLPVVMGYVSRTDLFIEVPADDLPAKYVYASNADPRAKVFSELEASALNPQTSQTLPRLMLTRVFDDGMGVGQRQKFFDEISSSPVNAAKFAGLAGQVSISEQGSVAALVNLSFSSLPQDQVAMLARAACDYRGKDLGGIAALSRLSQAAATQAIEVCAAHALREIHTKDTLKALAALFNSPIETIRYDAVIGIAQYAMNFPLATTEQKMTAMSTFRADPTVTTEMRRNYPGMGQFSQNEERYINYWKVWLVDHPVQGQQ